MSCKIFSQLNFFSIHCILHSNQIHEKVLELSKLDNQFFLLRFSHRFVFLSVFTSKLQWPFEYSRLLIIISWDHTERNITNQVENILPCLDNYYQNLSFGFIDKTRTPSANRIGGTLRYSYHSAKHLHTVGHNVTQKHTSLEMKLHMKKIFYF